MLMKSGKVVVRTNSNTLRRARSKVILIVDAKDVHSLPSKGDYILVPNENGHSLELEVLSIYHDLLDNSSDITVEADHDDFYTDIGGTLEEH